MITYNYDTLVNLQQAAHELILHCNGEDQKGTNVHMRHYVFLFK